MQIMSPILKDRPTAHRPEISVATWTLVHMYLPRLHHSLVLQQHVLAGNDLWQLINSSEYKPISEEVLTNFHFSSSHTSNFLITLTREMFIKKSNKQF